MNTVTVKKADLREALEENLKTHREDFEITWKAFQEKAIHNYEERLRQVKNLKRGETINLYVNLVVPEDHSNDYERALQMLTWEISDEVELQEHEFAQLVMDDWGWKQAFAQTNMMYAGSASPSKF